MDPQNQNQGTVQPTGYPPAQPASPMTPGYLPPQTPQQNISVNVPPQVSPFSQPQPMVSSQMPAHLPETHLSFGAAFARKGTELILLLMGALEVALTIRFTFKLFAAQSENMFVSLVYQFTELFVEPFTGIFRSVPSALGHVLEIETIIAGVVYVLVAVGLVKIIQLFK